MADEIKTEQPVEQVEIQENRADKRIKDLSGKVETTSKERDEAIALAERAQKEAGFYKEFTGSLAKFPQASQFQDVIKERVMKGYSVEDATYAVLAKENQLSMKPVVPSPVGGSAVNQPVSGKKSVAEMTQAERLEALKQAEKEGWLGLN